MNKISAHGKSPRDPSCFLIRSISPVIFAYTSHPSSDVFQRSLTFVTCKTNGLQETNLDFCSFFAHRGCRSPSATTLGSLQFAIDLHRILSPYSFANLPRLTNPRLILTAYDKMSSLSVSTWLQESFQSHKLKFCWRYRTVKINIWFNRCSTFDTLYEWRVAWYFHTVAPCSNEEFCRLIFVSSRAIVVFYKFSRS